MRPPLNAGENRVSARPLLWHGASFNEAPAERGGKRTALAPSMASSMGLQ